MLQGGLVFGAIHGNESSERIHRKPKLDVSLGAAITQRQQAHPFVFLRAFLRMPVVGS